MASTEQNQPNVPLIENKMSKSKKPRKNSQLKSAVPPVFILPCSLPPTSDEDRIFGLEICRAVEAVFIEISEISESEYSNTIECVQRCNGIFKIFLSEKKDRDQLLIKGISIRGHHITIYDENPLATVGQDVVRLKIKNIDYETQDEEVVKALKSIGFTLVWGIK